MFKYGIIGDLHLHNHHLFGESNKYGINQRLVDGIRVLDNLLEYFIEQKIMTAIVLGDVFETKKSIATDVVSLAVKKFREFKDAGIQLIFLVGNHDKYTVQDEVNFHTLEPLRDIGIVIDKPQILSVGNVDFFMLPYSDYKNGVLQSLYKLIDDTRTSDNHRVLLMHEDISGVKYDNGVVSSSSVKYEELQPDYFSYIFAGHIHKRTEYLRLIYVGSAYQLDFSEEGDDKGHYTLTTKDDKIAHRFRANVKAKKFNTILFDPKVGVELKTGNYYKIIVKDVDEELLLNSINNRWIEGKNFILDVQSSTSEVNQLDKDEKVVYDLKKMSLDYIAGNSIIFEGNKLNKDLVLDLLTKMGAV